MPAEPFKYDGLLDAGKASRILRVCKESALDIGCNTGELVGFLSSRNIYAEGIDVNPEFIHAARAKFPHLQFHVGDGLSIFNDGQFASVIAWDVLEHISDDTAALGEFLRIARCNVILSVPKEDDISLPYSRVTYRPYVDPTHLHYYTNDILTKMITQLGNYTVWVADAYRVRPLLAYEKIGIPRRLCSCLDRLFWLLGNNKGLFHANLEIVIVKG